MWVNDKPVDNEYICDQINEVVSIRSSNEISDYFFSLKLFPSAVQMKFHFISLKLFPSAVQMKFH